MVEKINKQYTRKCMVLKKNKKTKETKFKADCVGEVQRNRCTQPSPAAPKESGVWRAPVERE